MSSRNLHDTHDHMEEFLSSLCPYNVPVKFKACILINGANNVTSFHIEDTKI